MIDQAEIAAVHYVKSVLEYFNYETDVWVLAKNLGLKIAYGDVTSLEGMTIVLSKDLLSSRKLMASAIRHEIAHYLIRKGGIERQFFKHRCSYDAALPDIEKMCWHAELIMLIPEPTYQRVIKEHGHTAQAIVMLAVETGATLAEAMRRWVYAEVSERRAAFVVRRGLVTDAASANYWLPFWIYEEPDFAVPELNTTTWADIPAGYDTLSGSTLGAIAKAKHSYSGQPRPGLWG